MPAPPAANITLSQVEAAADPSFGGLRFPTKIEAEFEADTGPARCRRLARATAVGLGCYLLSLAPDLRMMPDVFLLALSLKLGVVLPLFGASILLMMRGPRPWLRETLVATAAVTIMAVHMMIVLASTSPLAAHAQYSAAINIIFLALIVRARFPYAVAGTLMSLTIYAAGVAHLGSMPEGVVITAVVTMLVVVGASLYANFHLEMDERVAYLATLRGRIRSGDLNRAIRELNRISNLDAMTGLANRRGFDRRFDAVWSTAEQEARSVAVLMVDVDRFKEFNDSYGHQAGDSCLTEVAHNLRAQVRDSDALVARYGGEEFIVVLPDADLLDGIRVAERVRIAVEASAIRHAPAPGGVVTVSIGVAAAQAAMDVAPTEVIEVADTALYEAKKRGRNRVWPPLPATGQAAPDEPVADVA